MKRIQFMLCAVLICILLDVQAQQQMDIRLTGTIPDSFMLQKTGNDWYFNGLPADRSPVHIVSGIPPANDGGTGQASLGIVAGQGNYAVTVREISPGPAFGAGLRRGDQIMQVNGQDTKTAEALERIISSYTPGTLITVLFVRRNKRFFTDFYLGEKNREINKLRAVSSTTRMPVISDDNPEAGMSLRESGAGLGLQVSAITKNGRAEKAGIKVGDRIISINDQELRYLSDINNSLWKNTKEWKISLQRDGNLYQTSIKF